MLDNDMITLVGLVAIIATAFSAALCKALEQFTNGKRDKKLDKLDKKVTKIEAMVKADMMVSMNVISDYKEELKQWYHPVYQELMHEKLRGENNGNGNS